jgi:hypothetical protein
MSAVENSFKSLAEISSAFSQCGCSELIVKSLSAHQDNEKSQIYLASTLSIAQYFPRALQMIAPSKSTTKAKSNQGTPVVALNLDFAWLWPNEASSDKAQKGSQTLTSSSH